MNKRLDSPGQVAAEIRRLRDEFNAVLPIAMRRAIDDIMRESKAECPHETGTLWRSAHREVTQQKSGGISCKFGYGTDYGVYVHEILRNYHAPPTKAKFLQDPVERNSGRFPEMVRDHCIQVIQERSERIEASATEEFLESEGAGADFGAWDETTNITASFGG